MAGPAALVWARDLGWVSRVDIGDVCRSTAARLRWIVELPEDQGYLLIPEEHMFWDGAYGVQIDVGTVLERVACGGPFAPECVSEKPSRPTRPVKRRRLWRRGLLRRGGRVVAGVVGEEGGNVVNASPFLSRGSSRFSA